MPLICKEARALIDEAAVRAALWAADEPILISHPDAEGQPHLREYDRVVVAGAAAYRRYTAERETLRQTVAEREARVRAAGGYMTPRQRDDMLCAMQVRNHAAGLCEFKLSTNIYGWCVEKTTNLGGGAASQTRRGLTQAEAVAWGIEWAKADPSRRYFTIYTAYLPEWYFTAPEELS